MRVATFSLRFFFFYCVVRLVSSFSPRVRNALCVFLSTDSSPWSAVRGSPELRAYSSMPRGSIPWPRRNGGNGGVGAAAHVRQPAPATTGPTAPNDSPAERQPTVDVNTVHLVDTCGHVVDMRPVPEPTGISMRAASTLQTLGDVDEPTGAGDDESEDDRQKRVAIALAGCLSRVQEDLKHIPPGKQLYRLFCC